MKRRRRGSARSTAISFLKRIAAFPPQRPDGTDSIWRAGGGLSVRRAIMRVLDPSPEAKEAPERDRAGEGENTSFKAHIELALISLSKSGAAR